MPKLKSKSKTKKTSKDTPPAERYAGVIAEDFNAKLDQVLENMGTIENNLGRKLDSFKLEVMQGFAKVDLRFMAVDQRFDKVEKELANTRTELKTETQSIRAELKEVEIRLSDKIDSFGNRLERVEEEVAAFKHSPKFI